MSKRGEKKEMSKLKDSGLDLEQRAAYKTWSKKRIY